MTHLRTLLFLLLTTTQLTTTLNAQEGKIINPFTDICWECLFPITVSGINVTPGTKDFTNYNKRICVCAGIPPRVGIPLTFWEPLRLVDITRHSYKLR